MQKKTYSLLIALLSIVFIIAPEQVVAQEVEEGTEEEFSLTVFHTNDIHASIDDFGRISQYLNTERANADHSLYLDAGDIFSGNPVVDLMDGIPMIELLNELNLDLLTIGNHEFDYGQEIFQNRRNESNFNWIAGNMRVVDPSIPIEPVRANEIFYFGDVSVGVIGVTQAPPATAPSGIQGLAFDPYIATMEQYRSLRDEVDILIALNHIGFAEDVRMAEALDFFDVIIGGHSHTTLPVPEVVNGTPIAQSGSNANNIGVLEITLNEETGEVSVDGRLQPVSELTEVNPSVQSMIDQYNAETDELLDNVIGYTVNDLERDARWEMDVSLGNLITDALRNFADTDVAITNNGGIRVGISAGEITSRDIFTVDPFGNVVTIIEMTGHELKDILAYSFHRSLNDYGPQIDLQTSGLNYIIYTDEEGLYADSELFIHGETMDLDQTYTIATNNFIVDGGDGYDFSRATILQEDQGQVTQALIQYIQEVTAQEGAVDYAPTEGRIQLLPLSERDDGEELTDAEIYTPILSVEGLTFDLNEGEAVLPETQTLIVNLEELPEGTVVTYVNAETIDLSGEEEDAQTLQILITYPDASTDLLELAVTVIPVVVEEETVEDDAEEVVVPIDESVEEDTVETEDLPQTGENNVVHTAGFVIVLAGTTLLISSKLKKPEDVR